MKRFITLILAGLLPLVTVMADGLDVLRNTLSEGKAVTMEYSFTAEKGSVSFIGSGVVTLQEHCYRLNSEQLDVYCDGYRQWTVNKMGNELIVESAPDKDFVADPKAILSLIGLNSKSSDLKVTDNLDGTLKSLTVRTSDGMIIVLNIDSMNVEPSLEQREFRFDRDTLDSSWVITDLT